MKRLSIIMLLFIVSGFFTVAGADVIYTNFDGSAFGASTSGNYGIPAPLAPQGYGKDIDMAFAFTVPAINYRLDTISASIYMGCDTCENALDIALMADDAGKPGAVVEMFHLINAMDPRLYPNSPVLVDSVNHPLLSASATYWISASAAGTDTFALWARTLRISGAGAYKTDSGSWIPFTDTDMSAFEISATPVPEPSSMILCILGVMTIVLIRKSLLSKSHQ